MTVSKRSRFEVLRRDGHACRYCGAHAPDVALTVDHVTPVALGGSDDPSNLVAACKDCNAGKASSSPDAALVAQVSAEALRWAAAIKLAAERSAEADAARNERLLPLWDCWYALVPGYKKDDRYWQLPDNWGEVVEGLMNAGLTAVSLGEAMRIALTTRGVDDRFRYFLGVARKRLAALHEEAARLIAEGSV